MDRVEPSIVDAARLQLKAAFAGHTQQRVTTGPVGHDRVALDLYDTDTRKQLMAVMDSKTARRLADALRSAATAAERL
jgi:hypothetical protein